MKLTAELLRKILEYNSDTGVFLWREKISKKTVVGSSAGTVASSKLYVQIQINKERYPAHRLVWLYINGRWPDGQIDHINGNKKDNRAANLRIANRRENQWNSRIRCHNKSGFKGVRLHKQSKLWHSRINVNGKEKSLGYFSTPEAAHAAYVAAASQHFGEFARTA